ncbi:MAG: hypothetical protein M3541_08370 [Acidobacteriota bacterium]|nr:hypothetical protein [Acidobacteriota bacterium]
MLAVLGWTVAPAAAQRGWDPLGPPQKQGAAPANAPTRVIVRALAGAGEPVTDLKAEELSIKVDGKDRKVENLELVTIAAGGPPAAAPAPAAAKPASTLPAPFATNTAPEPAAVPTGGREFLIILDEEGVGPGREEPVRKAIAQLTASAAPSDRFGLISLRQGGFDIQASAPAVLTDTLTKFVGGGSQSESLGDLTCRTKRALSTLGSALRASSVGRTILLVTPGLPASPAGVQQMRQVTGDAADSSFSDLCQIRSNDFEDLGAAALASAANVYVLHYVDGMANTANIRDAQQGIENIAGTVNAELVRISGGSDVLERIMSETSSYYIATLDSAPAGAVRRVDARSTRAAVKLVARPAGRVRGGTATAAGPAPKAGSPRDMIRVPTVFRDIPLRATGLVSRVPGKTDLMVMALFEPEDPATKLNAAIVALYDEKGTLKAQWTAQPKELEVTPVAAAVPVAPGSYRMRVAVTDASGKAGTTDTDVVVQLKDAGPVKLGSIVMGIDQKSPKLQFTGSDPRVIGFVPIYGVTKDMKISIIYEVRESESGAPLGSIPGNLLEMPGAPDTRMVWAGFGLPPLAPGDYQLKVIVTVDGQEAGAVARTLRKVQ